MTAALAPRPAGRLDETIEDYLAQISLSLRASSVYSARGVLRRFAAFMAEHHPEATRMGTPGIHDGAPSQLAGVVHPVAAAQALLDITYILGGHAPTQL